MTDDAWFNIPTWWVLIRGTFAFFFFTNFIDNLAETGTASFIFEMKVLRGSMTLGKTVLPECISPLL